MRALADGEVLSLNDLAERTLTHQSSVSVVVTRLVRRGLVRRRRAPDDARRLELAITAAGRALLTRAPAAAQERLIAGLEQMDAADRRLLAIMLGRLVAELGVGTSVPPMLFEEPDEAPPRARRAPRPRTLWNRPSRLGRVDDASGSHTLEHLGRQATDREDLVGRNVGR